MLNGEKETAIEPTCQLPPDGWYCTRGAGHDGPCAAHPAGEILPPIPPEEIVDAEEINREIGELVDNLRYLRNDLEATVIKLGSKLLTVQEQRLWMSLGFSSWGKYCIDIQTRLNIGRSQLFQYVSVARALLPVMSEAELGQIGITKAIELKRHQNLTGKRPSQELIAHAKVSSVAEVRARCFLETHGEPMESQRYLDLQGFYCSDDERAEIMLGFAVAATEANLSSESSEIERRKQIMLALCREMVQSYPETAVSVAERMK